MTRIRTADNDENHNGGNDANHRTFSNAVKVVHCDSDAGTFASNMYVIKGLLKRKPTPNTIHNNEVVDNTYCLLAGRAFLVDKIHI